jgi:hypothetical protein
MTLCGALLASSLAIHAPQASQRDMRPDELFERDDRGEADAELQALRERILRLRRQLDEAYRRRERAPIDSPPIRRGTEPGRPSSAEDPSAR